MGTRGVCEDLAERLHANGWPVITTSAKPGRLVRLADMLSTIWRQRRNYALAQVDVYSGPAFFWAEASCWLLRRLRKPYVLTLHGGNLPGFARRWPRRARRLLRSAAAVTTPSRYLQEKMQPYRNSLCLLPNPLDLRAYPYRERSQTRPRLVWLRAFHSIYNPSLAPKVIALLTSEYPDIHLTMIGPDKHDGSLRETQEIANKLSITDHLDIPGAVPKASVPNYLSKGDIFLNTTRYESFGVSVMEAAALGLCMVSTNVGELPYLWQNEQDALLVPPDDPEAMAAAIRRILNEPGLSERLSRNARAKAEQYDWSIVLPQWNTLLLNVSKRK